MDRERQGRHAHHQQVAGRRAEGASGPSPMPHEPVDPRARHLRRLGQGGRREDLRQRRAAADARSQYDKLKNTIQHRGAASRSASGTRGERSPTASIARPAALRPRADAGEVEQLAGHDAMRRPARASRPTSGPPPETRRAVRLVAGDARHSRTSEIDTAGREARRRKRRRSRPAARSPT